MSEVSHAPYDPSKMCQLDHALIDTHIWSKPKMKALCLKFGQLSRLWLNDIILDLSAATGAAIEDDLALGMAEAIGIADPSSLLNYCLEKGILCRVPDGRISNCRVIEDQQKLYKTRAKWRRAKEDDDSPDSVPPSLDTVPIPSSISPENPPGIQGDSTKSLPVHGCEDLNTEHLKTEDLKKGEVRRGKLPAAPDDWPLEAKIAYSDWIKHRAEIRHAIKPSQAEKLFKKYRLIPEEFARAVDHSIEHGYQGLFQPAANGRPATKETNFDRNLRIIKESL